MSTWLEINGARVEKEFFDANVREAMGYDWTEISAGDLTEHVHCIICGIAIDSNLSAQQFTYKSKIGYLCTYCYINFIGK